MGCKSSYSEQGEKLTRCSPLLRARPTVHVHPPRGHGTRAKGVYRLQALLATNCHALGHIQPQGAMDSDDTAHLPRLLSSPSLRYHVVRLV
jgi:hypothetical protein